MTGQLYWTGGVDLNLRSRPITTFASINIDQTRLAFMQVCVSTEALEVSGFISRVGVQPIWFASTESGDGVSSRGGTWCSGGLGWETCEQRLSVTLMYIRWNRLYSALQSLRVYLVRCANGWQEDKIRCNKNGQQNRPNLRSTLMLLPSLRS